MRKKHIIATHNNLVDTLDSIKKDLIKYVEGDGAEWVDHGTDDNDRVCFKWRDMTLGIGAQSWYVDDERVSFFIFLATITQE